MDMLEQLLAEREIRQLIARYPQLADDADADGFVALFAEDGVLAPPGKQLQGRAVIKEWLLATLQHGKMRHLFINPHIEIVSPIEARGSMDMLAMRPEGGTWAIAATLRYSDRYVRTDEGWRFAERLLKPMMP